MIDEFFKKITTISSLILCVSTPIYAKTFDLADGDKYVCQTRELISTMPDEDGQITPLDMKKSALEELFSFQFKAKQNLGEVPHERSIEFDDNHWWVGGWKFNFWSSLHNKDFDNVKFGERFDKISYTDFTVTNGNVTVSFDKTLQVMRITQIHNLSLAWLIADCKQIN